MLLRIETKCYFTPSQHLTSNAIRSFVVPLMDPGICSVFDTSNDGHCLEVGTNIPHVGVPVHDRRPQHGTTRLGSDGQVEFGEIRAAAFLHIIQVHVKGENPYTRGSFFLERNIIGMRLVELRLVIS